MDGKAEKNDQTEIILDSIAARMGRRAIRVFARFDITIATGATPGSPENIVTAYLHKKSATAENVCDMSGHHHRGE